MKALEVICCVHPIDLVLKVVIKVLSKWFEQLLLSTIKDYIQKSSLINDFLCWVPGGHLVDDFVMSLKQATGNNHCKSYAFM